MNFWDILLLAAIAFGVLFAVIRIVKNKKQGKNVCGGDCSHCSGCGYSKGERK